VGNYFECIFISKTVDFGNCVSIFEVSEGSRIHNTRRANE